MKKTVLKKTNAAVTKMSTLDASLVAFDEKKMKSRPDFADPIRLDQDTPYAAKRAGILEVQAVTHPGRGNAWAKVVSKDGSVTKNRTQHMPFGGHHATISVAVSAGSTFIAGGEEGAKGRVTVEFTPYS